ncbi:MAG: peptidylprolyl isomerase [Oscillospiraceae bacterium]
MSKMSKSLKVISIVTLVVVVLGLAATIAVMIASYDPENPPAGLYVDGKRIKDPGVMLTVGTHEISYPEYRYYYLTNKYYLSGGDTTYWASDEDGAKAADLKAQTEEYIRTLYAWVDLADEMGVGLTQEEKDDVLSSVASDKREYGTEYKSRLLQNYLMDEETYIHITQLQTLQSKIQAEYKTQVSAEYADQALEGIVTVKHILVMFDSTATDTAANEADVLAQSEQILDLYNTQLAERLAADPTADPTAVKEALFEELRLQYDGDTGQTETGYTFGEGTMVDEFYAGALALQEGEVSPPVRTDYGYHLILRLPLDQEYVDTNRETLTSTKISTIMSGLIQQRAEGLTLTEGALYGEVSVATVK